MNYKKEYIRLYKCAAQAIENVDFDNRTIHSFAALIVLKNAVDWGAKELLLTNQDVAVDANKCTCADEAPFQCTHCQEMKYGL